MSDGLIGSMRMITSADTWCHADFIPMWSAGWRRFFPELKLSLVLVGSEPLDELQAKYGKYADTIIKCEDFRPYYGHVLAKMSRLWHACQWGDEIVTLEDIDLIPLQREWRQSKFEQYHPGCLMLMGTEVYGGTDTGRTPMSCMTAPSSLLKSIINPNDLSFREFVDKYRGSEPHEDRADTLNAPYFSDEKLMQKLIAETSGIAIQHIRRGYTWETDTADRAVWDRLNYERLFAGGYFECHCLKNYLPNMVVCDKEYDTWGIIPGLKPIMDYIGFADERMPQAIEDAVKLYGLENTMRCYNATKVKVWQ